MGINLKDKNQKKIRSIKSKTILTFSLFSIFLIAFIWAFQAIYFGTVYENVKTNEVESISSTISTIYKTNSNYSDTLIELSIQKDVGIIIFTLQDNSPNIIFNSTRENNHQSVEQTIDCLLFYMGEESRASFINNDIEDLKILTCGKAEEINGIKTYFCISAPIVPISNTTENFKYLLVFISIGVFCATLIGSYCLSSQLSHPIVKMANKAKQLSNSNMNVKFNSNDYAEVKQLSDTLNYAIGELQKTDAIRKEVIANVSHELKTPLTMIKSYTELIRDISGENPEKRKEHLDVIYREAEKLDYLINDMMDYSKLESGLMTYNRSIFNLSDMLKQFKISFSEKYTNFKFTLSAPKTVEVFADKTRIEQVVTNLLNNAINYSTTKKEINIRLKAIDTEKLKYKLEIIDHGMGISKENFPNIFNRHFRSSSAKRATVGSGIGLSIVKSILDSHDFEYGVTSEENKGSTFFIIFTQGNIKNEEKN